MLLIFLIGLVIIFGEQGINVDTGTFALYCLLEEFKRVWKGSQVYMNIFSGQNKTRSMQILCFNVIFPGKSIV